MVETAETVLASPTSTDTGTQDSGTQTAAEIAATAAASNTSQDVSTSPETTTSEAPVIPETYADFTTPEGIEIAEGFGTGIAEYAKQNGLTQEQAQAHFNYSATMRQTMANEMVENAQKIGAAHLEAAKADPEIGGEHWDKTLARVKVIMDRPEMEGAKKAFADSGLGNHPEIIRLVAGYGALADEDTHETGGKSSTPVSMADEMYPNLKKK